MILAVVILKPEDEGAIADFLSQQALSPVVCWRVDEGSVNAQLAALETECGDMHPEVVLFPASQEGDELATRLAWRLQGSAVCQAMSLENGEAFTVKKAVYGNALTALLQTERRPLCLSLSPVLPRRAAVFPSELPIKALRLAPIVGELPPPEILSKSEHPLQSARVVLAAGQGAMDRAVASLAEKLKAEIGFTRQRVMAGHCDEQRMLGISGQSIAPEVCLIAGASGASAFMAGVAQSQFIVAINHDPNAPVFAAADVGIVGEAEEVLDALASCAKPD